MAYNERLTHKVTGNTAGVMADMVTGSVIFAGGNNITLSQDGNIVTISGGAGGGGLTNINVSAGTTSNNLSAFTFSNLNGVSFGLDASTITASHNALTSQSNQNVTAGNGGFAFQTLSFSNLNGISFGTSAGSAITASHNALTSQSNQAFSADASSTFQTLSFQDSNGISFSNNAGAIRLTHALQFTSNTSAITSNALHTTSPRINVSAGTTSNNLSAITFSNGNGVSFGLDGSTMTASVAAAGGAQTGISGIVVSDTTYTSGTVTFQNANGISFGSSGANGISASYTVPTVTNSSWTVSDNATSGTVGRLAFTNLNGVTLSLSTGAAGLHTIVGSHNALTSQSNQNVTAGNGGFAFQTLSFSNVNGVSFGTSAGSAITASYTRNVASNAIQSVGSATGSGTNTSRFAADDHVHAGVFSVGVSNLGNTVGDTRVDVGRFVFQGGNNITLSQITAANALNTIIVSAAAGGGAGAAVSLPANGASRTSGGAGYSNITSGTANFFGNNLTLSQDGASITFSANAPGAAVENNWLNALGANTAGNTTASGSTIGLSGINLTISGTNNSVFNLSVPATSSLVGSSGISISSNGSTITIGKILQSTYVPQLAFSTNSQTVIVQGATSASARFFPIIISDNIIFNEMRVMHNLSYQSSSVSGRQTISYSFGLYSNNGGSLSSISSNSFSLAVTGSSVSNTVSYPVSTGTAGYTYTTLSASTTALMQSYWGTAAAGRPIGLQFANTMSLSSGRYWLGVLQRHSSSSANIGISMAIGGNANAMHNSLAYIGVASSAQTTGTDIRVPYMGLGAYTVTQSTLPNGVPLTQIAHTQTIHPLVTFIST